MNEQKSGKVEYDEQLVMQKQQPEEPEQWEAVMGELGQEVVKRS